MESLAKVVAIRSQADVRADDLILARSLGRLPLSRLESLRRPSLACLAS